LLENNDLIVEALVTRDLAFVEILP